MSHPAKAPRPSNACRRRLLCCALGLAGAAHAQSNLSEQDFFEKVPEVLTVSRLAQPLSDTPGAVTIIDRKTLQDFNVRDMADILRLVPGYYVSGYNGANPIGVYHAPVDEGGVRNLVLIDGRPAYSTYYFGGTMRGLMSVDPEDVERVEILRGSNSAAYGANAMFGVINIVTRHSGDSVGTHVTTRLGGGGLRDARISVGRGDHALSWRISASERSDDGLEALFDSRRLRQLRLRADARPSAQDEVQLDAGISDLRSGEGYAGDFNNPQRTLDWRDWHLNGVWRHQRSDSEEFKVSMSLTQETLEDSFAFPLPGVRIDFSGVGRRLDLELQHQLSVASNARLVWGAGIKVDQSISEPLYSRPDGVSINEKRLFGNLEWRFSPQWLLNAGLFLGHNSWVGGYTSPRLMLNYQPSPEHTFRGGFSRAVRTPSLFELASDTRYNTAFGVIQTNAATGNAQPERLQTQELGYFYNNRARHLTLDVRVYRELFKDRIQTQNYGPGQNVGIGTVFRRDYVNLPPALFSGFEYQLKWSPLARTEFWVSQGFADVDWAPGNPASAPTTIDPPTHATTLAVVHEFNNRLRLSALWSQRGAMAWRGVARNVPSYHQFDVHVAYPFRLGTTSARAALSLRQLNGPEQLFISGFARPMSRRQAFATLQLEF